MNRKGKAGSLQRLARLKEDLSRKRKYKKPAKPARHRRRNMIRVKVEGSNRTIWLERFLMEKETV